MIKRLPVVGGEAFKGNTTITSIVIPDSIMLIYENAFMECSAIERVVLGKKNCK